ncbi:OmpA family protein [Spartinivicinus ruber]|uniref:OmpA family protein n=1 Tax=Spartinivicinus ruber TaxID=2683272 RepID=UPI0013CFE486|nr:OmpA family protein [Spartinivicinus ruber]
MKKPIFSRKLSAFLLVIPLVLTGCATQGPWYEDWRNCAYVGATTGAVIGSFEDSEDAAIGAVGGAIIGGVTCALMNRDTDSDGDGVPNSRDKCPATPSGAPVDVHGCALDSDNDGVPDYRDECPNTPPGAKVNVRGCLLDSDNDGVTDNKDHCPNSPPGAKVNALGCTKALKLDGVEFEFNSDKLTWAAKEYLNSVAEKLKLHAGTRLELGGHTDSRGSDQYNRDLSQRRANSVRRYLVSRGIRSNDLRAVGYGESRPVADNNTDSGRARNRRVELKVLN